MTEATSSRPLRLMPGACGSSVGPPSTANQFAAVFCHRSRLATEADEVVKLKQVGPGLDVFAGLGELRYVIGEELQRLRVAVRAAAIHVIAPLLDFPRRAFVFRVGLNPFQDFAVAFAFLEL